MLIKRNVYFSAIDEDGEERLYSTTEVMDEMDYIERLYAESDAEETLDNLKAAGIGGAAVAGLGATAYGVHKGAGAYAKRAAEKRAAANEATILEAIGKKGGVKKALKNENKRITDAAYAYQDRMANYEALQKQADAATAARKAAQKEARAKVMKDVEKGKIKLKDAKFLCIGLMMEIFAKVPFLFTGYLRRRVISI